MTTGTRILNGLISQTFPANAVRGALTTTVGPFFQKTWSGADSPPAERQVRVPSRPKGILYHPGKGAPRRRALQPHSYTMDILDHRYGAYEVCKDSDGVFRYIHRFEPFDTTHLPLDPKDHYKVIEKLRRKVYGSGFHPGIFAAEMPKALVMITTASTQIRNALIAAKRGNWRGVVRNLGAPTGDLYGRARYSWLSYKEGRMSLSKFWLALQYGWLPLMEDLEEATAYIATNLYGNETAATRRVSATRRGQKTDFHKNETMWTCEMSRRTTKFKLKYVITNLTTTNFVPRSLPASLAGVAWEVMPYSFVVDWVAPIGAYLQALRTAGDLHGQVVVSVFRETTWDYPTVGLGVKGYRPLTSWPSSFRRVSLERTVMDEIIPPSPLGDLSPGNIFSVWQRAANAVALLQNLRFNEGDRLGIHKLLQHGK